MHECPKCGFSQPKDRYCASCGIDIEVFQKRPEPVIQSLKKNTTLHAAVAVLIIAALFTGIYISQREAINKTLSEALTTIEAPAPPEEAATESNTVEEPEMADSDMQAASATMRADMAPTEAEEGLESEEAASKTPPQAMVVSYAEVPRPLLQIWASEGQILSESANSRSILLKFTGNVQELRRQDWRPFMLSGAQRHPVQVNTPTREDYAAPMKGRQTEVGMVVEIIPTQASAEQMEFDLQISFNLPTDLGDDVNASTVTGHYIMPPGTTLAVAGLLPQQSVKGEAIQLFSSTPLAVLQSPEFLSGASEFVIFIQPQ